METTTMFLLGPVLIMSAVGFLCWLLFTLAVFALPIFIGITVGIWSFHTGACALGAIIVSLVVAGATFGIGQLLLAFAPWAWARLLIIAVYTAPSAMTGYAATHGIAQMAMSSPVWQAVFSVIGVVAADITALARISGVIAPPGQPDRAYQGVLRHS
jgi:hypothetical protein